MKYFMLSLGKLIGDMGSCKQRHGWFVTVSALVVGLPCLFVGLIAGYSWLALCKMYGAVRFGFTVATEGLSAA